MRLARVVLPVLVFLFAIGLVLVARAAIPTTGRIVLTAAITQPAVNEARVCPVFTQVDYEASVFLAVYKPCNNATPPVVTQSGISYTFSVTATGFTLSNPGGGAPTTGTNITFATVESDLSALPGAVKTLVRRAVAGT